MIDSTIVDNKKDLDSGKVQLNSSVYTVDTANVIIDEFIIIDELTEMRLDIISQALYGSTEHIDVLCKFNGISNPFTVKIGDIIAVPNLDSLDSNRNVRTLKPIQEQKKKLLTDVELKDNINKTNPPKSTPSKKAIEKGNFTKGSNGVIVF